MSLKVLLAQPRGFCAGVTRAIAIVDRALTVFGAPVYVRHEIVHNRTVVDDLKRKGAIFVDDLADVPDGAVLVFSAHGVPAAVERQARSRPLRIFDATCPLVTKVHREVVRMRDRGRRIIMIGHAGHPEVEGTMGQVQDGIVLVESPQAVAELPDADCGGDRLSFVTQTTISVDDARNVIDALKARWPLIQEPKKSDVCYATQNRQDAVKKLARTVEVLLVIGSQTSSNSNRLREVGEREGTRAYLLDGPEQMQDAWFEGISSVGITAGASAPEFLVQNVVGWLSERFGPLELTELEGAAEHVEFPMPKGLWEADVAASVRA